MDRQRVIALVEAEVKRREALARLGGFFAKDHLELAAALGEVLAAYRDPPQAAVPVFRAHNLRPGGQNRRGGRSR